jgi:hypothetical protein
LFLVGRGTEQVDGVKRNSEEKTPRLCFHTGDEAAVYMEELSQRSAKVADKKSYVVSALNVKPWIL